MRHNKNYEWEKKKTLFVLQQQNLEPKLSLQQTDGINNLLYSFI